MRSDCAVSHFLGMGMGWVCADIEGKRVGMRWLGWSIFGFPGCFWGRQLSDNLSLFYVSLDR